MVVAGPKPCLPRCGVKLGGPAWGLKHRQKGIPKKIDVQNPLPIRRRQPAQISAQDLGGVQTSNRNPAAASVVRSITGEPVMAGAQTNLPSLPLPARVREV